MQCKVQYLHQNEKQVIFHEIKLRNRLIYKIKNIYIFTLILKLAKVLKVLSLYNMHSIIF
jgi:hypothetical protein